jgi:hypothetical protein
LIAVKMRLQKRSGRESATAAIMAMKSAGGKVKDVRSSTGRPTVPYVWLPMAN